MAIYDSLFAEKILAQIDHDGSGLVEILSRDSTKNVKLSSKYDDYFYPGIPGDPNLGSIVVFDQFGTPIIKQTGTTTGDGTIRTFSGNNETLVSLSGTSGGGWFGVFNIDGDYLSQLIALASGSGWLGIYGENGDYNCKFSNLSGHPNYGYGSVCDDNGGTKAGMYVDASGLGVLFGDTKNFRMDYPGRDGKEIWYACIEGPEAAAYLRGTASLVNGKLDIDFPDHFKHVISSKSITVMLTPLSAQSKGLAVVEKSTNGFRVVELFEGNGNYDFDWEVKAVRSGYENYRVVRDKSEALAEDPSAVPE